VATGLRPPLMLIDVDGAASASADLNAHQAKRGTAFLLQEQAVVENLTQRKVETSRPLHRKVIYGTLYFDMPM
jgi:hypothetical protein